MKTAEIVAVPTSLLAKNSLFAFVKIKSPEKKEKKRIFERIRRFYKAIYREFTFLVHNQDDYYFSRIILAVDKAKKVKIYTPEGLSKSDILVIFDDRLERALGSSALNIILCVSVSVIVIMNLVMFFVPGSIWIPFTWPIVIPSALPVLWMGFKRMREDFKVRKIISGLKESKDLIFSDVERSALLEEIRERVLETFHRPVLTKDLYAEFIEKIKNIPGSDSADPEEKLLANSLFYYYEKMMHVSPDENYLDRLTRLWSNMFRKWIGRFKWFKRIDGFFTALEMKFSFNFLARMGVKLPRYLAGWYTSAWFMPFRILVRLAGLGALVYYTISGWLFQQFKTFWPWVVGQFMAVYSWFMSITQG